MASLQKGALAVVRQQRHMTGFANSWNVNGEYQDLRREAIHLYRQMLQCCSVVRSQYQLATPLPIMKKRCRLFMDMNKNVTDGLVIRTLITEGHKELQDCLAMMHPHRVYVLSRFFGMGHEPTILAHAAGVWRHREINIGRKKLRDKARSLVEGNADIPALPGPITDEDGNRIGYYHPKGPLPPGESELFARPPAYSDWGDFSLPDPWNPVNSPNGPPDPFLTANSDHTYRINLARTGPLNRHRTRRLMEHDKKTRNMSEYEYLEYFGENEVHYAANQFELPEYAWAESRMARRVRGCANENQEVFGPAREKWVEEFKGRFKGMNYVPAMAYWRHVFDQWVPNYNKEVVANTATIDDTFDAFISQPSNYAAYRSAVYEATMSNAEATPLATTMLDFVTSAQEGSPSSARRPYDHPQYENKWSTDNGLAQVLIKQEDVEAGLGCPHKASAVLEAELRTLKGEIGCVELLEKEFTGEWWNRGQIKLLRTLQTMHKMELCSAILSAANVPAGATQAEAAAKINAKDWKGFTFNNFSYLHYPDGDKSGVHAWAQSTSEEEDADRVMKDTFWKHFEQIFNYEQCVPVWVQGLSKRMTMNKPAAQGGWTLSTDAKPFHDKLVSM